MQCSVCSALLVIYPLHVPFLSLGSAWSTAGAAASRPKAWEGGSPSHLSETPQGLTPHPQVGWMEPGHRLDRKFQGGQGCSSHRGPEVSVCPAQAPGNAPPGKVWRAPGTEPPGRIAGYTRAPLHRPDPFFLLPSATLAAAKTAGKSELPSGKRGGRKPEGQGSVCVSVCGEQVRSGQWGKRVFELERKGRQEKRPRK